MEGLLKKMNIKHPPAMHHKGWWNYHWHRAKTPWHSTKTTKRHCGQVERPITPRREIMNKKTNIEQRMVIEEKDEEAKVWSCRKAAWTGNHVVGQLLRSGTSPYPNHGEAQAAEPPKDFIHKLRISLLNVCFLIRCWTFDVQCSMFIFKNNLSLMGS